MSRLTTIKQRLANGLHIADEDVWWLLAHADRLAEALKDTYKFNLEDGLCWCEYTPNFDPKDSSKRRHTAKCLRHRAILKEHEA